MTYDYSEDTDVVGDAMEAVFARKVHSHDSGVVSEASVLSYLGLPAGSSQHEVNVALNEAIGLAVEFILRGSE